MRLIDADVLYEYLDNEKYPCDKYAEVEDILDIIKNQSIIVPSNLDIIKQVFPNAKFSKNDNIIYGYVGNEIKDTVSKMAFNKEWANEKYKIERED